MASVPLYLLWYLLAIRKHSGELGYLKGRFERIGLEGALDEIEMLGDLEHLELIGVTDHEQEVSFDESFVKLGPFAPIDRIDERDGTKVRVPLAFRLTKRGRLVWVELLVRYLSWISTAVVCGIAGGLAVDAQGDHLHAWVAAVVVGVLLPALACLVLVKMNPHS